MMVNNSDSIKRVAPPLDYSKQWRRTKTMTIHCIIVVVQCKEFTIEFLFIQQNCFTSTQ